MGKAEIDIKELIQDHLTMTITLKRCNQWLLRMKIAEWLFRLGAWIAWIGVRFEDDDDA